MLPCRIGLAWGGPHWFLDPRPRPTQRSPFQSWSLPPGLHAPSTTTEACPDSGSTAIATALLLGPSCPVQPTPARCRPPEPHPSPVSAVPPGPLVGVTRAGSCSCSWEAVDRLRPVPNPASSWLGASSSRGFSWPGRGGSPREGAGEPAGPPAPRWATAASLGNGREEEAGEEWPREQRRPVGQALTPQVRGVPGPREGPVAGGGTGVWLWQTACLEVVIGGGPRRAAGRAPRRGRGTLVLALPAPLDSPRRAQAPALFE